MLSTSNKLLQQFTESMFILLRIYCTIIVAVLKYCFLRLCIVALSSEPFLTAQLAARRAQIFGSQIDETMGSRARELALSVTAVDESTTSSHATFPLSS